MVEVSQIRDGVLDYAHARVLPKLSPGKQFAAGTVLGIMAAKAEDVMREIAKNEAVKLTGIVAENGMIDLDALYQAAADQARRQKTLPIDIPMIGRLTFDENDIAELYRTISAH